MLPDIEHYRPNELDLQSLNPPWETSDVAGDIVLRIRTVTDFPFRDPWSSAFRKVLHGLAQEGFFTGQQAVELGVGDIRNIFYMGDVELFVGVDVDPWRLDIASDNLNKIDHAYDATLYHMHAVQYVDEWAKRQD